MDELDCNVCDNIATNYCSRCKTARYCSSECQKFDWDGHEDAHKIWCFDKLNPDPDHLNDLVDACLERRNFENDSYEEYDHEDQLIFDEEDDMIDWIQAEMEYPLEIGGVVSKVKTFKAKRKVRKGKKNVLKGKAKTVIGRGKEGRRQKKKGREQKRRGRRKLKKLRRKKRRKRKLKRK